MANGYMPASHARAHFTRAVCAQRDAAVRCNSFKPRAKQ